MYLSTVSPLAPTVHSGDDGASPSESTPQTAPPPPPIDAISPVHHTPSPPTDHSRNDARPSRLASPPTIYRPQRIISGTTRDPQDQSIRPKALVKLATITQLPCPRRTIPGTTKRRGTQDIATAIIPSDAPISPPAPSHMAAPAGENSAKNKETTRQRSTAHSVRTSSQVGA